MPALPQHQVDSLSSVNLAPGTAPTTARGWLLIFWSIPTMTIAHLVFAVATTTYILIAIQFEERDLVLLHPEYAEYRRRAKRVRSNDKYFRQAGLAFLSDADVSAVSDELFAKFVEHFVGPDRDISTLGKPFAVCATDLVEGRPAVFTRGPLHFALRATCAVPGLFAPQSDGTRLLIDGSTITEVPVSAALQLRTPATQRLPSCGRLLATARPVGSMI